MKSFIKNNLLISSICLMVFYTNSTLAIETENKDFSTVGPTFNKTIETQKNIDLTIKNSEIIRNLDHAKDYILKNEYPSAISKLLLSLNALKENQKKMVSTFFPKIFGGFKIVSSTLPTSGEYLGDSVNIIFSQRLVNAQGHSIDTNVLFADPSIEEYQRIIDNAKIQKSLDEIEIVTLKNKYYALKKSIKDSNYYELNIVINKETLLNIIANGTDQDELINNFCNQIDLNKLDKFLSADR